MLNRASLFNVGHEGGYARRQAVVINDVLEDAQFVAQHLELFRQVEAMVEDVSKVHVGPLVDGRVGIEKPRHGDSRLLLLKGLLRSRCFARLHGQVVGIEVSGHAVGAETAVVHGTRPGIRAAVKESETGERASK